MRYTDLHTHTHFSFDSDADLRENCLAAQAAGLHALAVTNHFDFDGILDGIYPSYLPHEDRDEIALLRRELPSDFTLIRGIEMGQPHAYAHLLPHLLSAHRFDFVLGSIHNLERTPDFSFLRFDQMPLALTLNLLERYFTELEHIARLSGIDAIAHITYPFRYMKRYGVSVDPLRFEAKIRALYHTMIENGISLEINTSGLRQGMGETMPSEPLIALYRDCGGKSVTVGSDAHDAASIGASIKETTDHLLALGFTPFCPQIK